MKKSPQWGHHITCEKPKAPTITATRTNASEPGRLLRFGLLALTLTQSLALTRAPARTPASPPQSLAPPVVAAAIARVIARAEQSS